MNIVVLTADEPLYLSRFFDQLFRARAKDVRAVFLCRPAYGQDSTLQTGLKYLRAFGVVNLLELIRRTASVKFLDRLGRAGVDGRALSIPSACRKFDVLCESVEQVNDSEFLNRLRELDTDLIVSVSCPQIFKQPLIELPRRGCLNMHGALLPKYRGIAPSFWMMHDGEIEAGVTVFLINRSIDLGDVIEVQSFAIRADETLDQFIVRSKSIACDVLLRAMRKIESGDFQATPLKDEGGSYFGFPTRAAYREFRRRGRRLW